MRAELTCPSCGARLWQPTDVSEVEMRCPRCQADISNPGIVQDLPYPLTASSVETDITTCPTTLESLPGPSKQPQFELTPVNHFAHTMYIASIAVFLGSLALPTVEVGCCSSHATVPGIVALLAGILYAISPEGPGLERLGVIVCWLANPLFGVAIACFVRGRFLFAALGAVVALIAGWLLVSRPLLIGYYAWLGSFALLATAGLAGLCGSEQRPRILWSSPE
jgi:hypothetical protein